MPDGNYEAVLTVRVVVPFTAELKAPELPPDPRDDNGALLPPSGTGYADVPVATTEAVYADRRRAAREAEKSAATAVEKALGGVGEIESVTVEEVRDA